MDRLRLALSVLLFILISSALSDKSNGGLDIIGFFSNIGHGIKSIFTGRRVTFQGSAGPSSPGHRIVSKNPRDIRYLLYNERSDTNAHVELHLGETRDFDTSTFRRDRPVKILIHGFKKNSTGRFPRNLKNVYLRHTDHNLILVDWGKIATPDVPRKQAVVFYPKVVDKVPLVGENVGKFILFILENGIIDSLDQVHIIGFSLGAHVAGFAGAYLERKGQEKVGRITGLDPAGPLFSDAPEEGRLGKSDAKFVDVVHSSRLGLFESIGHVDFYPNGGRQQPNCSKSNNSRDSSTTFRNFASFFSGTGRKCGHYRAAEYFAMSIQQGSENLTACKCDSWKDYLATCKASCAEQIVFGEYCPDAARGKYFLEIKIQDDESQR